MPRTARTRGDFQVLRRDPFTVLPYDVWWVILENLDVQSHYRCETVSKSWLKLINDWRTTGGSFKSFLPPQYRPDLSGQLTVQEKGRRIKASAIEYARYEKMATGRASTCRKIKYDGWIDVKGDYLAWDNDEILTVQKLGFKPDGSAYTPIENAIVDESDTRRDEMRYLSPGGYVVSRHIGETTQGLEYEDMTLCICAETGDQLWLNEAPMNAEGAVFPSRFLAISETRLYTLVAETRLVTTDLATGATLHDTQIENDALANVGVDFIAVIRRGSQEAIVTLGPGTPNMEPSVLGYWTSYSYNGIQLIRPEDGRVLQRIPGAMIWGEKARIIKSHSDEGAFAFATEYFLDDRYLYKFEHFAPDSTGKIRKTRTEVMEIDVTDLERPGAVEPSTDPFRHLYTHMVWGMTQPSVNRFVETLEPIEMVDAEGHELEPGLQVDRWYQGTYEGEILTIPPKYEGTEGRRWFYSQKKPSVSQIKFAGRDRLVMEFKGHGAVETNRYVFDFAFRKPVCPGTEELRRPGWVPEL